MKSGLYRRLRMVTMFASCGLVISCGDDSGQFASGGPQTIQSEASLDGKVENRPPEVRKVRFDPVHPVPGKLLRVHVGASDPDHDPIELGHTWKINGQRMPSSGPVITVPAHLRKGDRIEVSVVASDGRTHSEPSVQTILIGNRPPSMQEIKIHIQGNQNGELGHWVADPSAKDPDGDELVFRYSWLVNGRPIDEEGDRLARAPRKRGDEIQIIVWATDGQAESAPLESARFTIGNSPPDIHSRPPAMDPSGKFIYQVEASDRDGDRGLRYSLEQGPEGMTIDAFSGELRWQATHRHAGEHIVELAVDDRHGGETSQTFYVEVTTGPASPR